MLKTHKITEFLVGTDPEMFLVSQKTGKVKSAVRVIPGTKEKPHKIKEFGEGFAVQTDNILAEFNVPPANNQVAFVRNILKMQQHIKEMAQAKNPDLDIKCMASAHVPKSELRSKQAKAFGCDPDYNVYTGEQNEVLRVPDSDLRSAGMHIHLGYNGNSIDNSLIILRYFDLYLGVPSVLIDPDTERRSLYGKAGCFRLTPYGLEYRSLSSYMMKDEKMLAWVWNQVINAITAYNRRRDLPRPEHVIESINTNNKRLAKDLCNYYGICVDCSE